MRRGAEVRNVNRVIKQLKQDFLHAPSWRLLVTYSLLILMILFSAAVGFGLAGNGVSWWGIALVTLAAIVALQVSYIVTSFYW